MSEDLINAKSPLPRIAMVSTHGYVAANPPLGAADTGGQVVYVLELAKKLSQLGYEVDIWTRRFENQPELDVVNERVRVIGVPCGGKEFLPKEYLHLKLPEWSRNALRFIKKHELKYAFLNSHYWDAGVASQRLAEVLRVPHLHTPHSLGIWKKRQMEQDHPEDAASFEQRYNFTERIHHERLLYAAADLVIATTPQQSELLVQDYGLTEDHCPMIPPGYDDHRFYPVSEATRQGIRQRLGFTGKVVLALGRLARNKGYDLLIQGFGVLASREPEAVLHLAVGGENSNANELKLLAELKELAAALGLAERIRFSSFIPDADLADHYRAADLFVLSSRYEPFGMTAIESLACGTPTIVTIHGGLWKALTFGRNALFTDPLDKEDLGIMMLKPFRFPRLRARLSRMGAYKARSLFTWSGIAQQLVALVEHHTQTRGDLADTEWDEPWTDTD